MLPLRCKDKDRKSDTLTKKDFNLSFLSYDIRHDNFQEHKTKRSLNSLNLKKIKSILF